MTQTSPLVRIPVGVVVERCKAQSPWIDYVWRPVAVLAGEPETAPWTVLAADEETTTFYAGSAGVDLYRSETTYYRDNLRSRSAALVGGAAPDRRRAALRRIHGDGKSS